MPELYVNQRKRKSPVGREGKQGNVGLVEMESIALFGLYRGPLYKKTGQKIDGSL